MFQQKMQNHYIYKKNIIFKNEIFKLKKGLKY